MEPILVGRCTTRKPEEKVEQKVPAIHHHTCPACGKTWEHDRAECVARTRTVVACIDCWVVAQNEVWELYPGLKEDWEGMMPSDTTQITGVRPYGWVATPRGK
jgi:hypothetical protein